MKRSNITYNGYDDPCTFCFRDPCIRLYEKAERDATPSVIYVCAQCLGKAFRLLTLADSAMMREQRKELEQMRTEARKVLVTRKDEHSE